MGPGYLRDRPWPYAIVGLSYSPTLNTGQIAFKLSLYTYSKPNGIIAVERVKTWKYGLRISPLDCQCQCPNVGLWDSKIIMNTEIRCASVLNAIPFDITQSWEEMFRANPYVARISAPPSMAICDCWSVILTNPEYGPNNYCIVFIYIFEAKCSHGSWDCGNVDIWTTNTFARPPMSTSQCRATEIKNCDAYTD